LKPNSSNSTESSSWHRDESFSSSVLSSFQKSKVQKQISDIFQAVSINQFILNWILFYFFLHFKMSFTSAMTSLFVKFVFKNLNALELLNQINDVFIN
jgi:hypothetical protein